MKDRIIQKRLEKGWENWHINKAMTIKLPENSEQKSQNFIGTSINIYNVIKLLKKTQKKV